MTADRVHGHATPEGTRRGAESFGAWARRLGRTELTVSPIGFGGYRVRVDSALHRRALADALRGGVNLVDTSTNYGDGASESLVGTVLANLVQQGELRRENVIVVSKVGYVQGSNLARVRARSPAYPEIVRHGDDLWHCMHPDFIEDQLDESLERLGLEQLDVLLLHNPEYFLMEAGRSRDEARRVYDDRLRRAFARLEALVKSGRIGWYGVSSNGFVEPRDEPTHTSVARVLELAQEAGGSGHRLAVVQMPMNLLELGAAIRTHETAAGPRSPLRVAVDADLGVLVNRPLNAFADVGGAPRLVRLADEPAADKTVDTEAVRQALAQVRKLEGQWATGLGKQLVTPEGDDAVDLFRWGQELAACQGEIRDLQQWNHLRHEVLAPQLGRTSAALLDALDGSTRETFAGWWTRYGAALHHAFEAIEAALRSRHGAHVQAISSALDDYLPEPWQALPLSRKAVLTLLGAPVSTVLVGMRHPGYVVDMLGVRDVSPAEAAIPSPALEQAMQAAVDEGAQRAHR
jgi:uncharacterized protein